MVVLCLLHTRSTVLRGEDTFHRAVWVSSLSLERQYITVGNDLIASTWLFHAIGPMKVYRENKCSSVCLKGVSTVSVLVESLIDLIPLKCFFKALMETSVKAFSLCVCEYFD